MSYAPRTDSLAAKLEIIEDTIELLRRHGFGDYADDLLAVVKDAWNRP